MKLTTTILVIYFTFSSCAGTKRANNANYNEVSISKMECGSYVVIQNDKVLGYVVPPLFMKFSDEGRIKKEIANFEHLLLSKSKQKKSYRRNFRVYHFSESNRNDTLLGVMILSKIQSDTIANWRCKYLSLPEYGFKYYHQPTRAPGYHSFAFNCTKNRFAIPEDGY